ncbi:hypothetical protein HC891_01840, partial [Candidatus Gracilibacteria bacterium]|nr:hypothetical protein [Candidatus Gracilibacteria bacterium]
PRETQSSSALYLVDRDGANMRMLRAPQAQGLRTPAWSPDGTALYITALDTEQLADGSYRERPAILRIDVASSAEQLFLENARDLVLSAITDQIAYISPNASGLGVELRLAASDGGQHRSLIAADTFEELAAPRFAPDGSSLIVAARGEQRSQGSPLDTLSAWLVPSTAHAHGTPWDIWRVDLASGALHAITALREDEPHAAFSPNGSEIVVHGVGGIYRMDVTGTRLRRIDPLGGYGGIDWAR